MRVAVTGGAGFIGANLCGTLTATEGVDGVVVVDDFSTGRRENLDGLDVELVEGSILDPEVLDKAFERGRRGRPPRGAALRAPLDPGPDGEPRGERHRDPAGARGGAAPPEGST